MKNERYESVEKKEIAEMYDSLLDTIERLDKATFCYAGIGSRSTPESVLHQMTDLAWTLREMGYTLRSGGCAGADTAFEAGAGENADIFLPWPSYGCSTNVLMRQPSPGAYEIAEKYHPAWDRCSRGARALHARNSHIILGSTLSLPVDFVLYWTPDGAHVGGTGQALRIATDFGIPCLCVEPYLYGDYDV